MAIARSLTIRTLSHGGANCNQTFIAAPISLARQEAGTSLNDTPRTPHERLRRARQAAGFPTAAEAARAFGWTLSAYRHHENGTAGFSRKADVYASAFGVTPEWLLFGRGDSLQSEDEAPRLRSDPRGQSFAFDLAGEDDRPLIEQTINVISDVLERTLKDQFHNLVRDEKTSRFIDDLEEAIVDTNNETMLTSAAIIGLIDDQVYMDLFSILELRYINDPDVLMRPDVAPGMRRLVNRYLGSNEKPLSEESGRAVMRAKFLSAATALIGALISAGRDHSSDSIRQRSRAGKRER